MIVWGRRATITAAVVVVVVAAAVAALPWLVDSAAVRRVVEREISTLAGAEVRYDSLAVHFFPQPRATVRGVSVRVPGAVDGRAAALDVGLALLPLLTGSVRPTAIRVEQPAFEVRIEPGAGAGDPFTVYRESVGPVIAALARDARGMTLEIADGRLEFVYAGQRRASLSALAARADVSADAIDASASSAGDLWRAAQGRVTITPGSLAATAKLQVSGLHAGILEAMQSESGLVLRPGPSDASVEVRTDGRSTVNATFTAASPQGTIARGSRTLDVGAVRVAAEFRRDGEGFALALHGLQLGELLPQVTGSFRVRPDGAAPALELQVPAVDLGRLRAAALTLADDLDAVRTVAAIVQGGTARTLAVSAAGSDLLALGELKAFRVQVQVEAAAVAVADAGITVRKGAGRLELVEGELRGTDLNGAIGGSRFDAGALVLAFVPTTALRSLDAAVDADLADVLAITRRVLGRGGEAVLADIESVRGRASGRFAYEARRSGPHFAVDVAKLAATGRYRGVPFPLEVSQGEVNYAGDRLRVRRLAGSVGGSRVQGDGEAELVFGAEPAVHAARATLSLVLDELHPWLASLERLQPALKELKSLTGTTAVRLVRMSGPLADPAAIDFQAVVQPQRLRASLTGLPAPVTVAGGEANVTSRAVRLNGLQAALLDARVTVSGTVQDYASPHHRRVDLVLASGAAGQKALDWARARWQVPPRTMPRAPLSVTAGRLRWPADVPGSLGAQGTVGLAEKVDGEFDVTWRPDELDLRRLSLKDADSDATIALKWTPTHADLVFRGTLDNRTVERLLAPSPEVQGSLRGDFHASIDLRAPRRSTATGTLEGEGIDALERWELPVLIDRVRLDVAGGDIRIRDTVVRLMGERFAVSGTVERKPETFAIDAKMSAERVDAGRLLEFRGDRRPTGATWDLPVEGKVAIAAKAVVYDEHVFQPVVGSLTLAPNRVVAEVPDTRLCGVALSLSATATPSTITLTGRGQARDQDVAQSAECLARENIALTGRFDLDLDLAASGPPEALLRSTSGNLRIVAREGRIQRAPAIIRILFLNNVAALLRSGPEELIKGGLEYREMALTGMLDGTRLLVERATLDSPSLGIAGRGELDAEKRTIAMRGLVAPFANINAVARNIPWVGRLFDTRLVGIPFSVYGDWRDPTVVPLGPAAVGQSLVDLMGATFKAPIELLDPFVGTLERKP
jgi:hypothetical protein